MAVLFCAKVASGGCVTESEVIRDGLRALNARERAVDDWLRQQALPSYEAYRANPSKGLSLDEVRATVGKRNG